jgi:hypothetical protein
MRHDLARIGGPFAFDHLLSHIQLVLYVLEGAVIGKRLQHFEDELLC